MLRQPLDGKAPLYRLEHPNLTVLSTSPPFVCGEPALGGQTHRADVKKGGRVGRVHVFTMALLRCQCGLKDGRLSLLPSEVGGVPAAVLHFSRPPSLVSKVSTKGRGPFSASPGASRPHGRFDGS